MKFRDAIDNAQNGIKMTRWGWHREGMYITSLFGKQLTDALKYVDYVLPNVEEFRDTIVIYTGDRKASVGWVPSQEDMAADDWYEYENTEHYVDYRKISESVEKTERDLILSSNRL